MTADPTVPREREACTRPNDLLPLPKTTRTRATSTDATVAGNVHLADRYWRIEICAPEIATTVQPGQFVMMTVARDLRSGPVLPRPMAIYDTDPDTGRVTVVYSIVGTGTQALSTFSCGERLTVTGPLGQGFQLPEQGDLLLLGRGIGTCSLTLLARQAHPGRSVTAVASGRHPQAIVGAEFYRTLGLDPLAVHEADGSSDPQVLERRLHRLLDGHPPVLVAACGSHRLEDLGHRLAAGWGADFQLAVEARMACGLGYCHGCAAGDRSATAEAPLVCADGPVFRIRH